MLHIAQVKKVDSEIVNIFLTFLFSSFVYE